MHPKPSTSLRGRRKATTKPAAASVLFRAADHLRNAKEITGYTKPCWLTGIGRSVQEIRVAYSKEAYRVIYVTKLADCIYVLHAFHKKSKTGIETPKGEIDLAKKRYKELVQSLRRS